MEAEAWYRRLLLAEGDQADALHLLGLIVHQRGAGEEAVALLRKAIAAKPSIAFFHDNLGIVLHEQGRLGEAIAEHRRALALQPDSAVTHHNLGNALRVQGDWEGALAAYREALRIDPGLAEAHAHLGNVLHQMGRFREAIAALQQAVALKPGYIMAHHNLGTALLADRQFDAAIAAYRQVLEWAPQLALAHNNLGNALKEKGLVDEAIAAYRRAVEADPEQALALNNLANTLKDRGEIEAAIALYRRAVASPGATATIHSNYLTALHYSPQTGLASLAEAHREYHRRYAWPCQAGWPKHSQSRDPDRPLRLGFVSPHFRFHPVGHFLVRLLENLDRQQFQITCYADRPGSDDAMTERLRAGASAWHPVERDSDEELARRIRGDRIDILFDLAGHTAGHRLLVFARKPAPVQMTWLDYVGTTGLSAIDYLIGDPRQIPPEAEPYYGEKILRMPDDYITFDPPADAPPVGPLPAAALGRVTFASFNIPPKTTPLSVETWSRILREVPDAQLLLKNKGFDDPMVSARHRHLYADQAIDPGRILYRGWSAHAELLGSYHEVDIALDTIPYNGGLTTCQALWMGVPVVTCAGETFASRHGLAHLHAAGFTDTIARDFDEYVKIAATLAGDLPGLSILRAQLRSRVASSPLCDGPRFAAHFAALMRGAWQQWCAQVAG